LSISQEEGELIIEGLLNVFWGVRRPIRLQMQDEKESIRPHPSLTSLSDETDINTVKSDIIYFYIISNFYYWSYCFWCFLVNVLGYIYV